MLDEPETAKRQTRNPGGQCASGAQDQIVADRAGISSARTANLERKTDARIITEPVANPSKRHETLDFMEAVASAPNHVQSQVDFRRRAKPEHQDSVER